MIYLDDSIMIKGQNATAGSKMLQNFVSPITATVVQYLEGDVQTVQLSEFGLEAPKNLPKVPLLCNDVFGFVRTFAAKQNLAYIRPTYGTVSRFGLVPTACSMDQIGVLCADAKQGFELLFKLAKPDEKDGAMFSEKHNWGDAPEKIRFAACFAGYEDKAEALKKSIADAGVGECTEIQNSYMQVADEVQNILAYAEISNNISRYDGVKFGYRATEYRNLAQLYTKSRTEGFGQGAKLAAIIGAFVLSQGNYEKYYEQAMKIRRMIKESLRFDKYDVLIVPAQSPVAVLAGIPSISLGGMQLVAAAQGEGVLRRAVEVLA